MNYLLVFLRSFDMTWNTFTEITKIVRLVCLVKLSQQLVLWVVQRIFVVALMYSQWSLTHVCSFPRESRIRGATWAWTLTSTCAELPRRPGVARTRRRWTSSWAKLHKWARVRGRCSEPIVAYHTGYCDLFFADYPETSSRLTSSCVLAVLLSQFTCYCILFLFPQKFRDCDLL